MYKVGLLHTTVKQYNAEQYFISITGTLEQREREKTITFFREWWISKLLNYGMYCTEACENPAVVILYISCTCGVELVATLALC